MQIARDAQTLFLLRDPRAGLQGLDARVFLLMGESFAERTHDLIGEHAEEGDVVIVQTFVRADARHHDGALAGALADVALAGALADGARAAPTAAVAAASALARRA